MTIENGKLAVGYLIVDASNGELIFDIRDYFNGFEDDIYGLTYFSNNLLCKSTDFYTPDSGYVFCDIDVKDADNVNIPGGSIKFIRSDILVCLDGNRVYSYGLDTRDVLWEQIVETDDPIIHLFDDKVVILDGQLIREVSLRSGSILHEVCLADNISELSTNQMKNLNDFSSCICEDSLVIYNGLGMDSWIMVIERSSYEVLYIKTDHDIGVVRICGDLIFYCNGQNKIQALWKDSGKLAWTSRENITARSINSAGNFLVVGVIHGGFTIFKVS
ncbi:hypothetical protein A3759_17190 [Thalassolituus sp. HI0120]|nr:hypothetical protein A3759_17190 [Thalassolituus sp. HI0120]